MTDFSLPPLLVDAATLPPPLHTSEPGSFAHDTLARRVPAILRTVIAQNVGLPHALPALEALYDELTHGVLRPLHEDAADRPFWDAAVAPYIGRRWLDLPWYFAEAYFYRRVVEATGYFQPGPGLGVDPYAATKQAEWADDAAPASLADLLADLPAAPADRFRRLLYASLWGNRADLSYRVAMHLGHTARPDVEAANLLADHSDMLWSFLCRAPVGRCIFIADNVGAELLADLALIDFLLEHGLAARVCLHLKPHPFFVSDATLADLPQALAALARGKSAVRELGHRIESDLADGRLRPSDHWFYTSSLFYFQLPSDLYADLAAADLVILKGDANYRRLLGDARWPPTTPFAQAIAYFPAPLVALRTLKAELIVGLAPGQAERLTAEDPGWLVNGRRGVIQARVP